MRNLPTGTLTLLFTDIEESSRLLHAVGDYYPRVLDQYQDMLRAAFAWYGGVEVDTQGEAFFIVFTQATRAVAAAVTAQRSFSQHEWPGGSPVRVRMGLHTGEPIPISEGYAGLDLHRAARICSAAHGGQILLSQTTAGLVAGTLPDGVRLDDLGHHRLKSLLQPERLYQVSVAGLRTEFPPLKSYGDQPTNLPVLPSTIIGRERLLSELTSLLLRSDVRLVTLTGTGGAGKTSAGIKAGSVLLDQFRDGVFFVALAPVTEAELVPSIVMRSLGLSNERLRSPLEVLTDYLRDKAMLLVLDNLEQVLDAAPLFSDLLSACPALKLLVTSRSALGLQGEHVVVVPPLPVPDPRHVPAIEALSRYAAVALFVERARQANPTFTINAENARAVVAICHRLDGLPLAIELAARRIKLLTAPELLRRLNRRLNLLAGGARELPERQQAMRKTIGWSYELLRPNEQKLFRKLSVFSGGCTMQMAEAVCGGDAEGLDVFEGIAVLVNHSLLHQREQSSGDMRFVMLETVREYAQEQLEALGEATATRTAHLRYFRGLARAAQKEFRGSQQMAWLMQVQEEIDNIQAALTWALTGPSLAQDGLSLASALLVYWWRRDPTAGCRWLERLLAADVATGTLLRAIALYSAGFLNMYSRGATAARELLKESEVLCRALNLQGLLGQVLAAQAIASALHGDREAAVAVREECIAIVRSGTDRWTLALALGFCGMSASYLDDVVTARSYLEECIAIWRELGEQYQLYIPIRLLGDIAYRQGDYDAARQLCEQSVTLGHRWEDVTGTAQSLGSLGLVAARQGELDYAETCFRQSLILLKDGGITVHVPASLVGLAVLSIARDQPTRAAHLLGAANRLGHAMATALESTFEQARATAAGAARRLLGKEFERALSRGESMTLDEALSLALTADMQAPSHTPRMGVSPTGVCDC